MFQIIHMNCGCYEAQVKACIDELVLKAGLEAATSYYWILENKFGQRTQRQAETDADGNLTIDLSVLPEGATNEFSGHWTLSIRSGANYLEKVPMEFDDDMYECVIFSFVAMDDDPENPYNVIE